MNTASRLGWLAAEGELLVSVMAADAAKLDATGLERRQLEVRGRSEQVDVVVVRP